MTGVPAASVDGVNCGASIVKRNVDFPSEAGRCQVRTLRESTDSLAGMQSYKLIQARKIEMISHRLELVRDRHRYSPSCGMCGLLLHLYPIHRHKSPLSTH